ncbi:MAG TPA: MFS transporter [Actinocrinis sp.]|nr:MFS transporter [Actinocrinis sp.]
MPDRKAVNAWALFSWADHAYFTTMSAALLGPWLLALATNAVGDRGVLFGVGPVVLRADAFPSFMIAAAAVVQLFLLPPIGALVDGSGARLSWLAGSCMAGSASCALFATTGYHAWAYAGLLFLVLTFIAGVADFVVNSLLGDVAPREHQVRISAWGSAAGYLGGGLLLAVNLVMVQSHASLGVGQGTMVRWCFLTAGIWWAVFGLLSTSRLRRTGVVDSGRTPGSATPAAPIGRRLRSAFTELRGTLRLLGDMPQTRRYLIAFLLFSDAVSAVIALASTYITHELFDNDTTNASPFLFKLILMIQFVAICGALGVGRLALRFGAKRVLSAVLVLWCFVLVYGYGFMHSQTDALVLGVAVAVGLGGVASLARPLFTAMIPAGLEGTFFSLYEICNQGTSWLAPLIFTVVVDVTGSFRQALLSLIILFVAGLAVLSRTGTDAAEREASAIGARGREPEGQTGPRDPHEMLDE